MEPARRGARIGRGGALPVDFAIDVDWHAKVPKPVMAGDGMRHHVDRHALCAPAGLDLDRQSAIVASCALPNNGFSGLSRYHAELRYPQTDLRLYLRSRRGR